MKSSGGNDFEYVAKLDVSYLRPDTEIVVLERPLISVKKLSKNISNAWFLCLKSDCLKLANSSAQMSTSKKRERELSYKVTPLKD